MSSGGGWPQTFRRETGLTIAQYQILRDEMPNGEMRRGKAQHLAASLHRVVDAGLLEYVKMGGAHYNDDVWRITEKGHALMRVLGDNADKSR